MYENYLAEIRQYGCIIIPVRDESGFIDYLNYNVIAYSHNGYTPNNEGVLISAYID
jgi:hypothetical protein